MLTAGVVEEGGFGPPKRNATDLQSFLFTVISPVIQPKNGYITEFFSVLKSFRIPIKTLFMSYKCRTKYQKIKALKLFSRCLFQSVHRSEQ